MKKPTLRSMIRQAVNEHGRFKVKRFLTIEIDGAQTLRGEMAGEKWLNISIQVQPVKKRKK